MNAVVDQKKLRIWLRTSWAVTLALISIWKFVNGNWHQWFVIAFLSAGTFQLAASIYVWLIRKGVSDDNALFDSFFFTSLAGTIVAFTYIATWPAPPTGKQSRWIPPELPSGCTNVIIRYGSKVQNWPRSWILTTPETGHILLTNLPDLFGNFRTSSIYSPRDRDIYIEYYSFVRIGTNQEPDAIWPYIVSNRLYIAIRAPYANRAVPLLMDYEGLYEFTGKCPALWDFNCDRARDVCEIVNEHTNPVLQIFYRTPNEVQVNGIFVGDSYAQVTYGDEPKFIPIYENPEVVLDVVHNQTTQKITIAEFKKETGAVTALINTNEYLRRLYRDLSANQKSIFKYPAMDHTGEFRD
jgi:hypothetical protein